MTTGAIEAPRDERSEREGKPPSMIVPPRIARGETLGVCAPAGPAKRGRLQRGLERFGDAFRVRIAPSVTAPRGAGVPNYLSASDDERADELTAMLRDPDIRAIMIARGGYGLMRILPRLDPELLRRDPKPIVGFSDATALLAWMHAAGVRGIHGPVIAQLGDLADSDAQRLLALLTDPAPPAPWSIESHASGVHRGPLITANLTMTSLLVGTPWPVPLAGAIALFEEVGERPYELDRYLTQLALTGELAKPVAIVLGDLTRCDDLHPASGDPDPPDAAILAVVERLATAGKPFALGAPVGHGTRNGAVPFGAPCELDLDRRTLTLLEGAVS